MPMQPSPRADTSKLLRPSLRLRIAWLRDKTATDDGDPRRQPPNRQRDGVVRKDYDRLLRVASLSGLRTRLERQLQHLALAGRSGPGTRLQVVHAGPEQAHRPWAGRRLVEQRDRAPGDGVWVARRLLRVTPGDRGEVVVTHLD